MARWLVILAGGRGERFWPLSRQMHPKQFLTLTGNRSMIRTTRDRVQGIVDDAHTWVVTGVDYVEKVQQHLPAIPVDHILGEPVGRNTAPSIAWAAMAIYRQDPFGSILVLPSDHVIQNEPEFRRLAKRALDAAEQYGGLYTFGILPTHPETGYGYIERDGRAFGEPDILSVVRFVEKPPRAVAEEMLATGRFFWNSGMFAFRAGDFLSAVEMFLPELWQGVQALTENPRQVDTIFPELPEISVDHGIMEKARNVYVLPADIGWDDVGTFAALARLLPRTPDRNAAHGQAVFVESENVTAISDGPVVSFIGVRDLYVIATHDAVLILSPDRSQDVRKVVQALKEEGNHDHIL
ncbi:mannose-1-phosphate guanylyltransferase [Sulfobacillus acidophilus TPY]|uniref:mannose-1-phosphate guanylyltransferase n=1 Tax=Sulfobacillus acidophilus (strain ATCC 700253 / DSM 10332 / NAL) TaxID=679936 RepID=G8TWC2_SULAD|nr:mannose-1-phosphate guanylyltransferase [Sulfobacillus acidophilus TPY]AEW03765.1 Mannose-1-phosphate guanylyltransferase [Sulfobacillus acidophilus DSM 10332]